MRTGKIGIVVIDDESLVRLGIKSSVEWEKYGYEIVGEADNGETGLEIIRQKKPRIVLLDICMPGMDGLQVLKQLRREKISSTVIVLSCHDDFNYVREAMKQGAYDYLRKKDINSANILTVLEEVRHSMPEDGRQGGAETGQEWDAHARRSCLQQLIGEWKKSENARLPVERLRIQEGGLCCVAFAVKRYRQVLERYEDGSPYSLEHNVMNLTMEVTGQRTQEAEVFLQQENLYVLLLSNRQLVSAAQWKEEIFSLLREMETVCQNYLNVETCYGVSGIVSKFSGLPGAFARARCSLALRYFQPDRAILEESREPEDTLQRPELEDSLKGISASISQKKYFEAFSLLEGFFQWLRQHRRDNLDVEGVRGFFCNMVQFILLQEGRPSAELVEKARLCETLEETEQFFAEFQGELGKNGQEQGSGNYLIRAAKEYIGANLSRGDISLDEIAGHLLISKSYLCRLFQKNLGISVQQYIHHTRIEQAKEYLNDFRLKIYEVAELTGFNSSTHFNIVFKKIMRCTPAEYRNGLKQ